MQATSENKSFTSKSTSCPSHSPVDDHDLPKLTMWPLRAVYIHGVLILDHDVESADRVRIVEHRPWDEARVDRARHLVLQRGAGRRWTSGLRYGVVREEELELQHVAGVCLHVVGCEDQGGVDALGADGDGDERLRPWCFCVQG